LDLRVFDQLEKGRADLAEVVGRDVGGHPDGDARRAVHQEVGDLAGEDDGFFAGAVVVGPEVDRALADLADGLGGDGGQAALGVPHGGGGVAVHRAEVTAAVDEG